MKVLQIACGYSYSKVYKKLFAELINRGIEFEAYVPQHNVQNVKNIENEKFPYHIYTNHIIKKVDKVLYFTKIHKMTKDVEKNFPLEQFDLFHAHSLFSDGAVAYNLYKKYNIPYIVTIRNTDVNKYFKYGIHLRGFALNILKSAKHIVFISHSYKDYVYKNFISNSISEELMAKTKVIPNGVDEFWLEQEKEVKTICDEKLNLIFVGRIDKNKNLNSVLETQKKLRKNHIKTNVSVVGEGPLYENYKRRNMNDHSIVFHGAIKKMENLKKLYKKNDILIVPSFSETFGLVYIEAISCGLPIIYTRKQGFDGYFSDGIVGYAVDPTNIKEIYESVIKIRNNYKEISSNCINLNDQFSWKLISEKYIEIYK